MYRGRLPQQVRSVAAAATGTPTAPPISYHHDGLAHSNVVPAVNKVHEILARNTVPTNPWNGALSQVEYEFPSFLGKVVDNVLYFDVTLSTSDAGGGTVQLSPTTQWFSRIEILYNSQVVETVEADEIHTEVVGFTTDQELALIRESINVSSTGGFHSAFPTSLAGNRHVFYLPLWATTLSTIQPFVRGFADAFRVRVTFANSIVAASTGDDYTIRLNQMKLYSTEANMSPGAISALEAAHFAGISYKTIIRNKFTKNFPAISNGSQTNEVLTTFTSDSAGLVVYVKPDSQVVSQSLTKDQMNTLELHDSANSQLTITLPAGLIEAFIMPTQVPLNSNVTNNGSNSIYIFPFVPNLMKVIEKGEVSGGLTLSGQERIVFQPLSNLTTPRKLSVISYEYARVDVKGKKARIIRSA